MYPLNNEATNSILYINWLSCWSIDRFQIAFTLVMCEMSAAFVGVACTPTFHTLSHRNISQVGTLSGIVAVI